MIPAIFGFAGTTLEAAEGAFFRESDPLGFILFSRNIESAEQVKQLTTALRDCLGRERVLILIDQEGGRVQRLGPPVWPAYPAIATYGRAMSSAPDQALAALALHCRLIAWDLRQLGINVVCAPVLDVVDPAGHGVIGDRSFGRDPSVVATLGCAAVQAFLQAGVLPVIKHMPGHGRAAVDSHVELPVVTATWGQLVEKDFLPFEKLADAPLAMTAHVVYHAIDDQHPASCSPKVIQTVIRDHIGFGGILLSDDISMGALRGSYAIRSKRILEAGCDIILHCNGHMDEMEAVAGSCPLVDTKLADHLDAIIAKTEQMQKIMTAADYQVYRQEYNRLMREIG